MKIFMFPRLETADHPAGMTISKNPNLPDGDFGIDEWIWPDMALWFVAEDEFTEDERQAVYRSLKREPGGNVVQQKG